MTATIRPTSATALTLIARTEDLEPSAGCGLRLGLGVSESGEGAAIGSGTHTDEEIASLGVAGLGTGTGRRMLVAGRAGRRASELTAAGRDGELGSLEDCSAAVGTGLTIPAQSGQIGCPAAVRSG